MRVFAITPALLVATFLLAARPASALADEERQSNVGFAVSLSAGVAWVDMGQFSSATRSYFAILESQVDEFEIRGSETTHLSLLAGVRGQLRLPRLITLEVGLELLSHRREVPISIGSADGTIAYSNTSLALPIVLGVRVPVTARIAVLGGAGPLLILRNRSDWSYSLGEISSFRGGLGGGFEANGGAELEVIGPLHVGVALRYRFAKSGTLTADGPELPPLQGVAELGWKSLALEFAIRAIF